MNAYQAKNEMKKSDKSDKDLTPEEILILDEIFLKIKNAAEYQAKYIYLYEIGGRAFKIEHHLMRLGYDVYPHYLSDYGAKGITIRWEKEDVICEPIKKSFFERTFG